MKHERTDWWLATAVLVHVALTVAHGAAHSGARVPLPPLSALFVLLVIVIAPVGGLALARFRRRAGTALVAASMTGALAFGVINHFVIVSPDHVHEVAAAWRPLFGSTALLLAVSEAAGAALALRRIVQPLEECR